MQISLYVRVTGLLALGIGALAGSITDIKRVVLFMQENRAFDHVSYIFPHSNLDFLTPLEYYGTMAGVRGFSDPNVQFNPSTNLTTFQQ